LTLARSEKQVSTYAVRTEFWGGNLLESYHLEDQKRWKDNIKMYIREMGFGVTSVEILGAAQSRP